MSIDEGPAIVVADIQYTNVLGLAKAFGTYHTWKVRTQNIAGTPGPWSQTITFTMWPYLPAPNPYTPLNGASVSYPVLGWDTVPYASYYNLIIWGGNYEWGPIRVTVGCDSNDCNYNTSGMNLINGIQYGWMILAVDRNGISNLQPSYQYWM